MAKFAGGCPVCGYSEPPEQSIGPRRDEDGIDDSRPAPPLPLWVWGVAIVALGAAIIALFSTL